jgi:hypothetical protein
MTVPITQEMLAVAVEIGSKAEAQARRFLIINRNLVTAIDDAVDLIETGRPEEARDLLMRALAAAAALMEARRAGLQ